MHGGISYSIGELARCTGLSVKTIRFYSDQGLVVPVSRTAAGYRRYAPDAVARLALVRTLRELGLGLVVIRRIVDRPFDLGRVAAEQAAALDVQISVLRLRRAVLSAVAARREPSLEEMEIMHRLATLSEAERRRLMDGFLDSVFTAPTAPDSPEATAPGSPEAAASGSSQADVTDPPPPEAYVTDAPGPYVPHPSEAALRRSLTPELPGDPTEEQVAAWVELAELSLDDGFRAALRRLVQDHAGHRPGHEGGDKGGGGRPPVPDLVAVTRDVVDTALASGTRPEAPEADPVVADLITRCALVSGHPRHTSPRESPESPEWLLRRLQAARDPRRDTYLRLLALVNGWPAPQPVTPVIDWAATALRARAAV
ncbi:MerR family transcriptional regulator [Streptomyces sp. IMTB 2501]|uniref:MerR family transcriptional regulator n=1 Tax=Streptomyces sp. IMTB 2501 TaxID=1776340 RepID=UPI0009A13CE5|nr:MerR family transcriptional regulator [Streptomyces sp. IMTB 2501]